MHRIKFWRERMPFGAPPRGQSPSGTPPHPWDLLAALVPYEQAAPSCRSEISLPQHNSLPAIGLPHSHAFTAEVQLASGSLDPEGEDRFLKMGDGPYDMGVGSLRNLCEASSA